MKLRAYNWMSIRTAFYGLLASVFLLGATNLLFVVASFAQPPASPGWEWAPAVSVDAGGSYTLNTGSTEGCPIESPDGHNIFFASNRPGGIGMIDIWVADNADVGEPAENVSDLPEPVNSPFNDFCPTPLPGGRLLFVSNRPSPCGGGTDIYETRLHPALGWTEPTNLGCNVNSPGNEFSPSVFEAGGHTYLYFSSDRFGPQQIFSSQLQPDGTWSPAALVVALNSGYDDARPNVSADGREIFFDSTRQGGPPDIYTSVRATPNEPWSPPVPLGPNVNSPSGESRATISRDGKRLYFGSTRPGGQGASDIYVSTRKP